MNILVVCHPRTKERMHPVNNFLKNLLKFSNVFVICFDTENINPHSNLKTYTLKSIFPNSRKPILIMARFLSNIILMNKKILQISKNHNVDYIIPFGSKLYSVFGSLFSAKINNSKYIIRDSGTDIRGSSKLRLFLRFFERLMYNQSDGVITLSQKEAERIKSLSPSTMVVPINQGIDITLFNSRTTNYPEEFEHIRDKSHFIFLFVGSLEKDKGIYCLLKAFELLKNNQCLLIIIGDGSCKNNINKIIEQKKLLNKVKVITWVPHIKMPQYYKIADVLVLPSLHEGLPNVVLEALAMKIPVLASNVGGISDFVSDGNTGLLINKINPLDLKQAMQYFLSMSYSDRIRMGKTGRKLIEKKCSSEKINIKLYEFINKIGKLKSKK